MTTISAGTAAALVLLTAATVGLGVYAAVSPDRSASAAAPTILPRDEIAQIVRETVVGNPEILIEAMNALDQRDRDARQAAASQALGEYKAELERDGRSYVAGNPEGDITIVEFFDYRCGFCKRARPEVLALLERDSGVRLVLKEFPILGPESEIASRAAIAARQQNKYWEFHKKLMAEKSLDETRIFSIAAESGLEVERLRTDMAAPAVTEEIDRNRELAEKIGIDGTPTFVVGSQMIPGVMTTDDIVKLVASIRAGDTAAPAAP